MPKLKPPKAHFCPACSRLMEQYGDVYVCRECNVSYYGPYLEKREGKK